ncbi:MAG: acyl-CoA dehydrogenase family protein [Myxococcota bacterium]
MNADEVRAQVRAWLEANWNPELSLVEWRNQLADSGWGCPTWPSEWFGRGLPVALGDVVAEEFERIGAVGTPSGGGMTLAAPTILEHGSDDLKRRLLRPIVTGEHSWCQLFSEPGSGSDLAGLTTRAEQDGDEYVVNGQKLWSTSAHHARYGMLLARTNWDVPKHRGISYFAIEMHQPGVVVRGLRQMNGYASFNEVFFNDARVPAANAIGEVGNGWTVALATLAHERRSFDALQARGRSPKGEGRAIDENRAEIAELMEPYKWYPQRAGRVDLIIERAKATGRNQDPVVRQAIAKLLSLARSAEWTGRRAKAARVLGRPPGPEGSLGKLYASEVARAAAHVHTLISGSDALLAGSDGPLEGLIAEILLSVPAVSIAGGTDEIQRNIVSERVLGMPKDPQIDAARAFRDVPKNLASKR